MSVINATLAENASSWLCQQTKKRICYLGSVTYYRTIMECDWILQFNLCRLFLSGCSKIKL